MPDERYEDVILRALPVEYDRVRLASYEKHDFSLADIRHMISTMYVDYLSRPNAANLVAGRGVAMQASGTSNRGKERVLNCYFCGKAGHVRKDFAAWEAARLATKNGGETDWSDGKPWWCPSHLTSNQGEDECCAL